MITEIYDILGYPCEGFHAPGYEEKIVEVVKKIFSEHKDRVVSIKVDANEGIMAKVIKEHVFENRRAV